MRGSRFDVALDLLIFDRYVRVNVVTETRYLTNEKMFNERVRIAIEFFLHVTFVFAMNGARVTRGSVRCSERWVQDIVRDVNK